MPKISPELLLPVYLTDRHQFDHDHAIAERIVPALGIVHTQIEVVARRLNLQAPPHVAMLLGVQAYEIFGCEDPVVSGKTIGQIFDAITDIDPSANFTLDVIEALERLAPEFPDAQPEMADAVTEITAVYLRDRSRELAHYALFGAALAWDAFREADFWEQLEAELVNNSLH